MVQGQQQQVRGGQISDIRYVWVLRTMDRCEEGWVMLTLMSLSGVWDCRNGPVSAAC